MIDDGCADGRLAPSATSVDAQRIAFLDGLRGLAALAVVVWHYTNALHEDYFPYGDLYGSIPVIDHGWIGVNLFFLISGYVILMTLERCQSFPEFMKRRWIRLFPAMLVASLTILAISQINGEYMLRGESAPIDLLPGLTFVIPTFWTWLLDTPVNELDGVFWTLYVEMGFYVVYGLLFFLTGWRKGLAWLAAVWIAALYLGAIAAYTDVAIIDFVAAIPQGIGATYLGWFIAGALFFKSNFYQSDKLFLLAIATGIGAALNSGLWQQNDLTAKIYLVSAVGFFVAVLRSRLLQKIFSTNFLLFLGAISYPIYLLHNEIGIGLIGLGGTLLPAQWWPMLPLFVVFIMIAAASVVAKGIEPRIARILKSNLLGERSQV